MNARPQEVQSEVASLPNDQIDEVQRLALTGYDFDHATHLVLKIEEPDKARAFLAQLLQNGELTFSDSNRDNTPRAINIGFTYRGLEALGIPKQYLKALEDKAPAFSQGAPTRAARRLGDTGTSAAERWESIFAADGAHALISIHGKASDEVHAFARKLARDAAAQRAFECLDSEALRASHLKTDTGDRGVHFGFRDSIARPVIAGATAKGGKPLHSAGELLLGYPNDEKFDRWSDAGTPEVARFFRNASFAAVRKIEQDEKRFEDFLHEQANALETQVPDVVNYVRAKLCGRWPNGAVVTPGATSEPDISKESPLDDFNFKHDPDGDGCPFGAHIRRTNPRDDPIKPPRSRPLFRRGMPYGPKYSAETEDEKRGLVGLFFCASLEDQFEHVMLEWIEKKPMGPRHRGSAKDPLAGHHDEPTADFYIPQGERGGKRLPDIKLTGFTPFLTTRGTLYAIFPSRSALREIAGIRPQAAKAAQGSDARQRISASSSPSDETKPLETVSKTKPAPFDRFCDVVMEGGVTSGIIYASAVAELAPYYRFRNIGGSSIGAFAAALTAAAEYSRRYVNADKPFQGLAELPDELAKEKNGDTRLRQMFKPQKDTRRLFEIFLATLGHKWKTTRVVYGLIATLWQYRLNVFSAAIVTAALAVGPFILLWLGWFAVPLPGLDLQLVGVGSWALALLFALAFAVVAAVLFGMVLDFRRLARNGFGMCRGWSKDEPDDSEDLTGYLYQAIQKAAGRDAKDPPLTFKDLWDAPKRATDVLNYTGNAYARRSINLEIYTTNLAHGRPYRFPLEEADDMGRLFFCIQDMEDYFPKRIVDHLVKYGRPYCARGRFDPDKITELGKTKKSERIGTPDIYLELPREHLPLAVAARLALSFPFLISAVPLWAIDYEPQDRKGRQLAKCWMSDGGLCSNFPIHLFDSFLPKWPTFGISLQTRSKHWKNYPDTVWLPEKHYQGAGDSWDRFAESGGPLGQLKGFLLSLWMATWHWNDMTMMRMPGVRDRVVRVLLDEGEGGINIKMSGREIRDLAKKYGKRAGEAFVEKFAKENSVGWPEHRWVRFNRLLISLREQIDCFGFTAGLKRHTPPLERQIDESVEELGKDKEGPLRGHPNKQRSEPSEKPLKPEQVAELKHLLSALATFETTFQKAGDHTPYKAMPRPSLRVRHPT